LVQTIIVVKSDAQLQRDVQHELEWDTRVEQTGIGVEVADSVVTLTGAVASYAKRLAAQEAAHRVAGVLDVVNDIRVQPAGSLQTTDTDIAHAVRHALEWDVVVPDTDIRSTVSDGWVTLEGQVGAWHEREAAEDAVQHLPGVRGLIDGITVELPYVRTEDIRDEVQRALERRADRRAKHVEIEVHGNAVTLAGPVSSWAEREAILGAARCTPGVSTVVDHLHFERAGSG
jgi:osmotically-inducible protein OsmY